MDLPENTLLPMFAYGVFQPGDLGFLRVKEYVTRVDSGTVAGKLMIRDGLPLLALEDGAEVHGAVLWFRQEAAGRAYYRIIELEPDKQYEWRTVRARTTSNDRLDVNTLLGCDIANGTVPFDNGQWRGRDDPFFHDAFDVVDETLRDDGSPAPTDLRRLFRVQMGYLLLWSILERYAALRYHLGGKSAGKVDHIATEPAFIEGLKQHVRESREVYRADDPGKRYKLNPDSPKSALNYYYQVRSNATHRGKASAQDFWHLRSSSSELLAIARQVVNVAFEEAKWSGQGD
jgi:hypothetical protein